MPAKQKAGLEFQISAVALTKITGIRDDAAEKLGESGLIPSISWGIVTKDGKAESEGFVIGLYPERMRSEISRILYALDGVEIAVFMLDEKRAELRGKILDYDETSGRFFV